MRILHLMPAFGPTDPRPAHGTVLATCRELSERGHEITVAGCWAGRTVLGEMPARELPGIQVQLFAGKGLRRALALPRLHLWLRQHANSYDIVHIHLDKDPVPALIATELDRWGISYVVQVPTSTRLAHPLAIDHLWTLPAIRGANLWLATKAAQRDQLLQVTHDSRRTLLLPENPLDAANTLEAQYRRLVGVDECPDLTWTQGMSRTPATNGPSSPPDGIRGARSASQTSLLWVTTSLSPHRIALWRELALITQVQIAVITRTSRPRVLLDGARYPFSVTHLRGGPALPGLRKNLRHLIQPSPDAVICDGWDAQVMPALLRAARRARVPVIAIDNETTATKEQMRFADQVDALVGNGADCVHALTELGLNSPTATVPRIDLTTTGVVDLRLPQSSAPNRISLPRHPHPTEGTAPALAKD